MANTPDRNQRKALGRGLSALLPARGAAPAMAPAETAPAGPAELPEHFEAFQDIPLEQIKPSSEQPRENFDAEKLNELADSIRANGVIQPITVRQTGPGKYQIIAGERRWRAAKLAGLAVIPALIRSADQHQRLELALIENLQREDLNPLEIATAFQRLVDEHKLSHEEIAERTGKDRSTVTNFTRLLKCSPFVRSCLLDGSISMGHARTMVNLPEEVQDQLCQMIIERQLSVRSVENAIRILAEGGVKPPELKAAAEPAEDPNERAALAEMEAALGTRVRLKRNARGGGRLEIEFYSGDDLDRIYSVITRQ